MAGSPSTMFACMLYGIVWYVKRNLWLLSSHLWWHLHRIGKSWKALTVKPGRLHLEILSILILTSTLIGETHFGYRRGVRTKECYQTSLPMWVGQLDMRLTLPLSLPSHLFTCMCTGEPGNEASTEVYMRPALSKFLEQMCSFFSAAMNLWFSANTANWLVYMVTCVM